MVVFVVAAVAGRGHGGFVGVHEGRWSVSQDGEGDPPSARGCRSAQGFWGAAVKDARDGELLLLQLARVARGTRMVGSVIMYRHVTRMVVIVSLHASGEAKGRPRV